MNSTYRKDKFPLMVKESSDPQVIGNQVRMEHYFNKVKDTILWTQLVINDRLSIEVKDNVIEIPVEAGGIKKIQLIFSHNNFLKPDMSVVEEYTKSFKTEVYTVNDTNSNVFTLSYPAIDLAMFFYTDFENEKLIIIDKKLKWNKENKIFELK